MTDSLVLKKAMDAFKKRLKVLRQDDESTLKHGPFSSGRTSSIVGVRPPDTFPPEVWEELADLGRLKRESGGMYSLPS